MKTHDGQPDGRKLLDVLQGLTSIVETQLTQPYGPNYSADEAKATGDACVKLCRGDQDQARTLWKLVTRDLNGYMPHAAAVALVWAANTENLVPDVEAPDPS